MCFGSQFGECVLFKLTLVVVVCPVQCNMGESSVGKGESALGRRGFVPRMSTEVMDDAWMHVHLQWLILDAMAMLTPGDFASSPSHSIWNIPLHFSGGVHWFCSWIRIKRQVDIKKVNSFISNKCRGDLC